MVYLGIPGFCVCQSPRCVCHGLSVLHQSHPQSGLGGIALYRDLCQVVVPQDGVTRDSFLQFAECILLWLVPDPFHLLVGELPLPQRLGDVREVGEELRQVLDHSQQPLTPSDIRGPWHCTLVGSARRPLSVVTCPINGTSCLLSLTLLLLSLMPLAAHLRRTASRFWSWSLTASSSVTKPDDNEIIRHYLNSL